jgi:hypothetical protein
VSEILPSAGAVIYEVDLDADAAIEAQFDTWLRDHIADVLQFPGFLSAEILADAAPPSGRIHRTVQYRLRDSVALDDYLENHAPRMRAQGIALFGDRFSAKRRALAHREEFIRGAVSTENCLNCGEVLTGQHCAHCGQRAKVRVLSLWGMTRDLLGDMLDWDARIWRTLRPLAFSPGKLTQDYLRGRRASYTPPFRMYVLLSVAFFLLATLGADPGSTLHFTIDKDNAANLTLGSDEPAQTPAGNTSATQAPAAAPGQAAGSTQAEAEPAGPAAKLDAETARLVEAIVNRMPEKDRARARVQLTRKLATVPTSELAPVRKMMDDPCSNRDFHVDLGPFGKEFEPRLRQACRNIWTDTPSFGRALFQNIPKMMFIFLPLIAEVMYLLYIGSGRYYVEHLLFVVHFHAFFFLGGIVILLAERAARIAPATTFAQVAQGVAGFLIAALVIYAPVYLFVAMRRVYGQGRVVTFLKYSALGVAYLVCMTLTLLGLLFYTALTL